jgi:hypothetical protein
MATWASKTADEKERVQQYTDQVLRSTVLLLARSMVRTSGVLVPQYLVSPTGLSSTMASPAANSVGGILASLDAGEVVPILNSGLPLNGPLLGSKVASYTSSLNNLLATLYTAGVQQDYAQIIGAPNLII